MAEPLTFQKYEGLGNDFVIVDAADGEIQPERARALCDRHFGVGADGVLIVGRPASRGARASMVVINADGSRPEMCGNGLRCVALHLAQQDELSSAEYVVDTDAGPRAASVQRSGEQAMVTLDMGRGEPLGETRFHFGGRELRFQHVSMGNPHAIIFDEGLSEAQMDEVGPKLSSSILGGSNVETVMPRKDGAFDVIVWERGVGRTLACGTGAAAVAVALALSGRTTFGRKVQLHLPGGPLELDVAEGSLVVSLRGPARRVFSGQVRA
ncbi:MAG TPA: diaminopimelate epimerase [Polyangiaceae bacterium]|nr:diaminopimelate epimerase [Polyangiaceae bacterium]